MAVVKLYLVMGVCIHTRLCGCVCVCACARVCMHVSSFTRHSFCRLVVPLTSMPIAQINTSPASIALYLCPISVKHNWSQFEQFPQFSPIVLYGEEYSIHLGTETAP